MILNIAMFDAVIPFFLSAISNAMCDTQLWSNHSNPIFKVTKEEDTPLDYNASKVELEEKLIWTGTQKYEIKV